MQLGVVFPQTEIGADPGALAEYARAVSDLGYHHVLAYDHVVGADPAAHPGWSGPYNLFSTFHEVFVLFGYLAALTELELVTGILILPQRQTVLVAKQAAEVDILARGRFRLGVGIGWNQVEYQALGRNFRDRGARIEEQVSLMRRLWTEPSVSFSGEHDRIVGAGIAPMPVQRPIPVWMGAASEAGYRRIGRIADGWIPLGEPGPELDQAQAVIARAVTEAGRDPALLGMEGRIDFDSDDPGAMAETAERWKRAGATHISVNTMRFGLQGVDAHIAALARASEVLTNS